MFAITAIAVNRVTAEPDYFLVRTLSIGDHPTPVIDEAIAGVVYNRQELIDFVEAFGKILVLGAGVAPEFLRVRHGELGYAFIESVQDDGAMGSLHTLPRFPFVNDLTSEDLVRLYAIDGMVFQPPIVVPPEALQRFIDFGWVRRRGTTGAELTELGRALLAFA